VSDDEEDVPLSVMLERQYADMLILHAAARSQVHIDAGNRRKPLSDGNEVVGVWGEAEFAQEFNQPLNLSLIANGDAGYDFPVLIRYTLDVKTFRKPLNLIQDQGKVKADIYVLAEFTDEPMRARLLGWEWGETLAKAPVREFGHGRLNHYIPRENLRSMDWLRARIMSIR
jgi:hypothetical protein